MHQGNSLPTSRSKDIISGLKIEFLFAYKMFPPKSSGGFAREPPSFMHHIKHYLSLMKMFFLE